MARQFQRRHAKASKGMVGKVRHLKYVKPSRGRASESKARQGKTSKDI